MLDCIVKKEATERKMQKTYNGWVASEISLSKYLMPGDIVDELIIDYVLECLPPVTWTETIIQMGEAYSSDKNGRLTYITFEKIGQDWVYTGIAIKPTNKIN